MLVSELSGDRLHYWVARALGNSAASAKAASDLPKWSTDWMVGGPLVERMRISIDQKQEHALAVMHEAIEWEDQECGKQRFVRPVCGHLGPTPLVAAMRCIVGSRFGREVPAE